MDEVKQATGFSKEGQEPVSGEQGKGTATQPFDQGNQQEDPSKAGAAASQTGASASETISNLAGSVKSVGKSTDGKSHLRFHGHRTGTTAAKPSKISKLFGKTKRAKTAQQQQPETVAGADLSDRPPNHLGGNVPPGVNATVVDDSPTTSNQKASATTSSKGDTRSSGFFGLFGGGSSSSQNYVTTQGGKKVKAGGKAIGQTAMKDRQESED